MQLTDSLGNKLCGTFGCILPNNHKGLHQVTPPRAVPFPKPPARPHHTHTSWAALTYLVIQSDDQGHRGHET